MKSSHPLDRFLVKLHAGITYTIFFEVALFFVSSLKAALKHLFLMTVSRRGVKTRFKPPSGVTSIYVILILSISKWGNGCPQIDYYRQ